MHNQAEEVIYNVSKYFTSEKQQRGCVTDIDKAICTDKATKVSKATVEFIGKEAREMEEEFGNAVFKMKKGKGPKLTDFVDCKCALQRIILEFINYILEFMNEKKFQQLIAVFELQLNIGFTGC